MKFKSLWLSLIFALPFSTFAHWLPVGNAEYTWGPFNVYTIALYSETGKYQDDNQPLMFSFKYEKPIEGKSFAISLAKEMGALNVEDKDDGSTMAWLKQMQRIFPDFTPGDILSYISLGNKGYFLLNNKVLEWEFDQRFDHAFIQIWLSPKSSFADLIPQLIGSSPATHNSDEFQLKPEIEQFDEDLPNTEIPPNFEFENKTKADS